MVTPETIGNMTRPPYRSVSPPTMMRPREPTTTGTATRRATSDSVRVPRVPVVRKSGPSGLISAQAQKFTAKPRVAMASITHGDLVAVGVSITGANTFVTIVPSRRGSPGPPRTSASCLAMCGLMGGGLSGVGMTPSGARDRTPGGEVWRATKGTGFGEGSSGSKVPTFVRTPAHVGHTSGTKRPARASQVAGGQILTTGDRSSRQKSTTARNSLGSGATFETAVASQWLEGRGRRAGADAPALRSAKFDRV